MPDSMIVKFARTLVRYSLDIQPGDMLLARTTTLAVPLLQEVYREALEAGANVIPRLSFDGQEETFLRSASDEQLAWVSPIDRAEMETISARLTISAPYNTRGGGDAKRQGQWLRGQAELTQRFRQRSADGSLTWTGTLFPTHALAQEAGMSLREYEEFVYTAMFLDREDPIAEWRAFSKDQQAKVDRLDRVSTLRIVAEDTDLTLSVAGRKWMNSDGHRNFPSGEVFTGPVEESANGVIRFTFPAVRGGQEVEDVRLRFENGRVVEATAARGQDYLNTVLDTDAGARFLGEVAIGNNFGIQRFTKNTLFDEKIGGTCHLAVGSSYLETGGRNDSSVHWDMVCDLRRGGEIHADCEVIHRDGRWVDQVDQADRVEAT
jgi:aminopeptidase